jgi:hypothetical protein
MWRAISPLRLPGMTRTVAASPLSAGRSSADWGAGFPFIDERMANIAGWRPAQAFDGLRPQKAARPRGGRYSCAWPPAPGRQAQTDGETQPIIGICGAARRTRFATRWVKSGLSMSTTTSGLDARIASAVCLIRRKIVGRRATTGARPMTAMSSMSKRLSRPCSASLRRLRPSKHRRRHGAAFNWQPARRQGDRLRPRRRRKTRALGFAWTRVMPARPQRQSAQTLRSRFSNQRDLVLFAQSKDVLALADKDMPRLQTITESPAFAAFRWCAARWSAYQAADPGPDECIWPKRLRGSCRKPLGDTHGAYPLQQAIGAFSALHGDDTPANGDAALAHIEITSGPSTGASPSQHRYGQHQRASDRPDALPQQEGMAQHSARRPNQNQGQQKAWLPCRAPMHRRRP